MTNMLLYRYLIANFCGFALLFAAWQMGYVTQVLDGDISRISYVIAALFAVGVVTTTWRVLQINALIDGGLGKFQPAKNAHVGDVAEWLVTLGLIGNVIGFVIALRGIDAGAIASAEGAQRVAAQLLEGMGVAFYSTLTGAVLALWTTINRRMLETATALLAEGGR